MRRLTRQTSQVWASIMSSQFWARGNNAQICGITLALESSPTAACSKLRSQSDPAYQLFPGLLRPRAHLLYCTMRPLSLHPHTRRSHPALMTCICHGDCIRMGCHHSLGLASSVWKLWARRHSAQAACGQRSVLTNLHRNDVKVVHREQGPARLYCARLNIGVNGRCHISQPSVYIVVPWPLCARQSGSLILWLQ